MGAFLLISLITLAIFFIAFIVMLRAERIPNNTITAFTGTLGSGKTYLAVSKAYSKYRLYRLEYKLSKLFHFKLLKAWRYEPTLYSNIPIKTKYGFSKPLTTRHLLMQDKLPERCIVVVDEIGQFASQWDYENPLVKEQFATLIRFFRHFTNGKMYVTDQTSDSIVKVIRSRLGVIYNLNDFHRWLLITPFYKVTTIPLLCVEDNNSRVTDTLDKYFFGFLPYKLQKKKRKYDSRCYKPLYRDYALRDISSYNSLDTRYLIDLSVSKAVSKDYEQNKQKYKQWLYGDVVEQKFVEKSPNLDYKPQKTNTSK